MVKFVAQWSPIPGVSVVPRALAQPVPMEETSKQPAGLGGTRDAGDGDQQQASRRAVAIEGRSPHHRSC